MIDSGPAQLTQIRIDWEKCMGSFQVQIEGTRHTSMQLLQFLRQME